MNTCCKVWPTAWALALAALAVVLAAPQPARAAGPWYVGPGGSDGNDCLSAVTACATINGALGKADPGDTIRVATGTYTGTGNEVVLLDKNATLSGGWDAGFTTQSGTSTLDGQGARRGIWADRGVTAIAVETQELETSNKTVNVSTALPGTPLTYTITLRNISGADVSNVIVTDTIPVFLTYYINSLTATSGTYGEASGVITWTGSVTAGSAVTITFGATVSQTLGLITNTAIISGGGEIITRAASVQVTPYYVYLPCVARNYCPPLYTDNFSDTGSGWPITDTANSLYEYLNGEYRILVKSTEWTAGARPGFKASSYIVAVDVRDVTGFAYDYGIIFGLADDWSQFYTFEVDPNLNRGYVIWRYNPSSGWTALASGYSGYINPGTATNRLKIERNGSLIRAYANGQLLTSVSDGSYTGLRHVGLTVSTYLAPNVDVRFDNFAVYPVTCGAAVTALGEASAAEAGFELGEPAVHGAPAPPKPEPAP